MTCRASTSSRSEMGRTRQWYGERVATLSLQEEQQQEAAFAGREAAAAAAAACMCVCECMCLCMVVVTGGGGGTHVCMLSGCCWPGILGLHLLSVRQWAVIHAWCGSYVDFA